MPIRRGFEGFELPDVEDLDPDLEEFELLQGGNLPRRAITRVVRGRSRGPEVYGDPIGNLLSDTTGQNLGRSEEFTLGASGVNAPKNILNITGQDQRGQVMTVTLDVDLIGAAVVTDLFATIEWGQGGVRYTADVDYANGTVFQVCASSIRITAFGTGSGNVKCSAQIGYTPMDRTLSAQRSILSSAALAAAATRDITIPKFAYEARVQRDDSTCPYMIRFLNGAGTVLSEIDIGNGPGFQNGEAGPFRIPNGARTLRIVNGINAMNRVTAIFGLHL